MFDFIISNAIIVSAANGYTPFVGSVAVKDGLLEYVGEKHFFSAEGRQYLDANFSILMPGLFNGHCHSDLSMMRGIGDDLTLLEQKQVFSAVEWFREYYSEDERYAARQLTYCEALRNGTTFINDHMYWSLGERAIDAMRETGIRGVLSEEIHPDTRNRDLFLEQAKMHRFIKKCVENGIIPGIAGIAEEDYTDERLKKMRALSEPPVLLTCHLEETTWRSEIVDRAFGKTAVELLYEYGLLNERFIASHVVQVSDSDLELLAETHTAVVNTPLCEMKIADGVAPIVKMIRRGIPVSLGTDGALWNNSNDIFREMKGMQLLQTVSNGIRSLSAKEILDMATINGAKAFGVSDRLGSLEPGKEADMILVSVAGLHMRPLRLGKYENVTSQLVYSATGADVSCVFIKGEMVVKNGEIQRLNTQHLVEKVETCGKRIAARLEQENFSRLPMRG